jgi:protein-tyrosine phosphatase
MNTEVIKIDERAIDDAKIKHAAQLIDGGGFVAFPTETVYGIACRATEQSLKKLDELKGLTSGRPYTLHIGKKADVRKYVPKLKLRAEKMIKNAWPGPLTIVFPVSQDDLAARKTELGSETVGCLYRDGAIGIRCPANQIASVLLQQTRSPVVAPSANKAGKPPAVTAQQVLDELSGQIELIIDGGECKYKQSSTVVKIGNRGVEILREGVYSAAEVRRMSTVQVLFVCTGNTCRSPMAEGIFKKYLAEKLNCAVDELAAIGYKVISAGVLNMAGSPARHEAISACAAKGVDIGAHRSMTVSKHLVDQSDFVFVMGQMHRERVLALSPSAADKCIMLAENQEIPDPISQPQHVYDTCADLIEKAAKKRLAEIFV